MAYLRHVLKQLEAEKKRAQKELERLEEAISAFGKLVGKRAVKARRKLSVAARKRIAAAQRARWAKLKAK
jgi:wobble nucleotide-excising tRNase